MCYISTRTQGLSEQYTAQLSQEAAATALSHIGDEIVEKLVVWTKKLPFYEELPVEVHTQLLSKRWSELVLLSACQYAMQARENGD